MRYRVFLTVLLLVCLFVSGCWSRNEVENLAIVGGVGIDKVKVNNRDKFLLTVNIIRPSLSGGGNEGGGMGGKPTFWRMSAIGESLSDCERNLNTRAPRRIFYGHAKFTVIGETAARESLKDIVDYMQRNRTIRLRTLLLVTRGMAFDLMNSFPDLENTIAKEVDGMESIASGRVSKVKIRDLVEVTDELITPGVDPVMAKVMHIQSPPTEPGGGPLQTLSFEGGAVISRQKLVGWLSDYETRGYLLAVGQAQHGAFHLSLSKGKNPDTTIMLTRSSSSISVKTEGEEVEAEIKIRAEGDLAEYHGREQIATNEGIHKMESAFVDEISQEVMQAVKKGKQMDADIIGFGETLYRSNPKKWKEVEGNWPELIPKINVKVKVTGHIRRTGFIAESYLPR